MMKSKKCLFNKTIFKSDFSRFWPISLLLGIAEFIIFPLSIYTGILNGNTAYSKGVKPYIVLVADRFLELTISSEIVMFIVAIIMAVLVFSYLLSPNKSKAFHAFPIGRKSLFITNFISGYLLLIIPQLFAFLLSLYGLLTMYRNVFVFLVFKLVSIFAVTFIFFSIAVLSVMLAGHFFSSVVIYAIINFISVSLSIIFSGAVSIVGYGLEPWSSSTFAQYLSPVFKIIYYKTENMYYDNQNFEKLVSPYYVIVACYVAAGIVIALLSYLLYKKRRLECAGEMTAYSAEIPVIRTIVSVIGGAVLTYFICEVFNFSLIGYLVFYVLMSLICFLASEMILKKEFKVFKLRLFIHWALCCAVSFGLIYGIAMYETNYIPDVNRVDSVSVNTTYQIKMDDKKDVEELTKLHSKLIDYAKKIGREGQNTNYGYEEFSYYDNANSINIEYTLDNGKIINRSYFVLVKDREAVNAVSDFEKRYPPKSTFELIKGDISVNSCLCTVYNDNYEETAFVTVDKKDINKFYNMYLDDFASMFDGYCSADEGLIYSNSVEEYSIKFGCSVSEEDYKKYYSDYEWEPYSYSFDGADVSYPYLNEETGKYDFYVTVSSLKRDGKIAQYIESHRD